MMYVTSLCHNHIPFVSRLSRAMRRYLSRMMTRHTFRLIPLHVPLSITKWISLRQPTRKPLIA